MMNSEEDPTSSRSVDVEDSQIPLGHHLKLQFQDILFNPKYTIGADQIMAPLDSASQTISITMSSSWTIDYQDFKVYHAVLSEEGIHTLRVIAEKLCSTCYFNDCVQMYIEHRKDIVSIVHRRLHAKVNVEETCVFHYWEQLNEKMLGWIQIARICVGNIFAIEKCLYEKVFGGLGTIGDGFFSIIAQVVVKLFKFLRSLLASRRLPERLEMLLPFYQEFYNFFPDLIEFIGKDSQMARNLNVGATEIMSGFKQHMIKTLIATERHVFRELSRVPTSGGGIHRLTEYVIRYMDLFSTHRKALADLKTEFVDHKVNTLLMNSNPPGEDAKEFAQDTIFLRQHLIRVIDFLLYNLKSKSNFYEQESLGHLFMMNNIHSVALEIKSSKELEEILGNEFQMKLEEKVELSMNDYLKTTWDGFCHFLKDEGEKPLSKCNFFLGKSSRKSLKAFNHAFDYAYQNQVKWNVADEQLRERLLGCILVKLIPTSNDFLEQFSCSTHKRNGKAKHPGKLIKYSVKDLETKVHNLFHVPTAKY